MKPRPFDYLRPDTVEEALALLAEYGDDARVLAGGQSLVPMLNLRIVEADALIDISRIAALDLIREVRDKELGQSIEIGAAVTQNKLLAWPQLSEKLPLVAAALPHVGHFQTRNKGTVCGSIAHADPSSELPLALALVGGEIVLKSQRGERKLAAKDFQKDMLTTARGRRIDNGGALSGRERQWNWTWRRFSRSGAPTRGLRHRRGRGGCGEQKRRPARSRRSGRHTDGAPDRGEWRRGSVT